MVQESILRMRGKDLAFELFVRIMGVLVFLMVLFPLWFVLVASFSDPGYVSNG